MFEKSRLLYYLYVYYTCKTFTFNLHVTDCRKYHIQYIEYRVYRTPYISEVTIVYLYKYKCFKFHKSWDFCIIHYQLPLLQWQWCLSQEGNSLSAHVQSLTLWHSWSRWQWHSISWQYAPWSPGHMVEAHSLPLEHGITKTRNKKIPKKSPNDYQYIKIDR